MKILLTGSSGYVGNVIKNYFADKYELLFLDLTPQDKGQIQCDLGDGEAVNRLAKVIKPDVIIHAAGSKDLAFCEKDPIKAFQINCDAIKNIALAFVPGTEIIYISTDYVFDGQRGEYHELDQPHPLTVYGKSKLCGEREGQRITPETFIILRLSALFDRRAAFIRYLHENLSKGEPVDCYVNAKYSPTYSRDFLDILEKIMLSKKHDDGIYHACGEVQSRYDFALKYAKVFGFNQDLVRKSVYNQKENRFLFPNLSMINEKTCGVLRLSKTKTEAALLNIMKGVEL